MDEDKSSDETGQLIPVKTALPNNNASSRPELLKNTPAPNLQHTDEPETEAPPKPDVVPPPEPLLPARAIRGKYMKLTGLRVRFLLILLILIMSTFIAITLILVRQSTENLKSDLIGESKSFAALATQPIGNTFVTYQNSGTLKIGDEVSSFTGLDKNIDLVAIISTSGQQLFTNNPSASIKVSSDVAASLDPTYIKDSSGELAYIVQPYQETYGIHSYDVVYGISFKSVNQSVQNIVHSIVLLMAAILLVSIVIFYFFINWLFLSPIDEVSREALVISRGDFNRQIKQKRNDEIGDLSTAVNTMATSLKANIAKLQETDQLKSEFLMIISHNLRTPLTVIEGYLDTIKNVKMSPEEVSEQLQVIYSNVRRLDHFAEDALIISSFEEHQTALRLAPLEIAPVIKAVAEEFGVIAKQKRIDFSLDINSSAWVKGSKPYLHSVIWNLLDNAYKFTKEGGKVSLMAETIGSEVEIRVRDTGIGIAEGEVPKLFTKFHRGTTTLAYNYEGTGIGLYLTKLIVDQHGGRIDVNTQEGSGSTFTIHLPIVAAPDTSKDAK